MISNSPLGEGFNVFACNGASESRKYIPGMMRLLLGFLGFSSIPIILSFESNSITPNFSGSGTGSPKTLPPTFSFYPWLD